MRFLALVAPLVGLAAAAPAPDAPSKVAIRGVSLLGSGCPPGSADVQVDATGTLFEATFSQYAVQSGPGTAAIDWRKNCKLTLNMEFSSGFQFSILDTNMIGFAEIPTGARGQCTNTFSFTGSPNTQVTYALDLPGHYQGNFNLRSNERLESWSPCSDSTAILNMNTACNLSPTHLPALIAVDYISGKLTVKFAVTWRPCRK
ncbi:hypothetical protein JDV02_003536 [Purpureocillium takamizusanense]|uniref:Secreted protein n=1 Tax=Purpureocillium takamizusanense TaxID=2060973 RepID=A0A9Q8QCK8_9HYPO|nr:uncharacterized protein JDV02_003536 [Purpureocillium takamizusanense]UNI17160.1 hypothetical protein JDV02_003536 [Purpureocillium takamizusanense]